MDSLWFMTLKRPLRYPPIDFRQGKSSSLLDN